MIELTDLPETTEKIVRQNARWYQGVLDDVGHLWATWRAAPTAFNLAQLVRHVVNKVVEWPIAAFVYPAMGYLGWHFAYAYRQEHPLLFLVAVAAPTVSLGLTVWVGGIVTQREIQAMEPYLPRPGPARVAHAGASGSSPRSAARPTGSSPRARPGASSGGRPATAATSRARRTASRASAAPGLGARWLVGAARGRRSAGPRRLTLAGSPSRAASSRRPIRAAVPCRRSA